MNLLLIALLVWTATGQTDVAWTLPTDPQSISVAEGEVFTFTWSGTHNVYEMADEDALTNCDFSDATYLGNVSSLEYTADNAGDILYFACGVDGHCAAGQILTVEVVRKYHDEITS